MAKTLAASAGVCGASARADRDRSRFAAYIAHELRTPMAAQRALLELALADPDADLAAWREIGEDVLSACKHQDRLLGACLALARSQSGLSRCETVDLGSMVGSAIESCDLREVSVSSSLERALTVGDPDLIERLVENLVVNAARHNRVGGWIEATTRQSRTKAVIMVENTGPPIPSGELTRLFEPFQQLDAKPGAAGGLGLGLVIAKDVAIAHDAVLSACPRPGGGLRVEVAFRAANRS